MTSKMAVIFRVNRYSKKREMNGFAWISVHSVPFSSKTEAIKSMMRIVSQPRKSMIGGIPSRRSMTAIAMNPMENSFLFTFPERSTPITIEQSRTRSHSVFDIKSPNRTPEAPNGYHARDGRCISSSKSSPNFRQNPAKKYAMKYTIQSSIVVTHITNVRWPLRLTMTYHRTESSSSHWSSRGPCNHYPLT